MNDDDDDDDMKSEYDFSAMGKPVRGKYAGRIESPVNMVSIDPDLIEHFPTAKAVNDALREFLERRARKAR
jgi:hypothetical protein